MIKFVLCGDFMSSKNKGKDKNIKKIDNKKNDEKSFTKNNYLIISFIVIICLLLIIVFLIINRKDDELKCDAPIEKEIIVEKEPDYQLINYQGFRFKMPLDWNFVSHDNSYEISNKDENLFITLDYVDVDYSVFVSEEYQKNFLEEIQTSSNTKIESSKNNEKNYYLEGFNNEYNYVISAVGNEEKVILVKAQFVNKLSFDKLKEDVVNFSISSL